MKKYQREGAKNIWGPALRRAREQSRVRMTQVDLAAALAEMGLPLDRSAVSRIENQQRILTDKELLCFVDALRINFFRLGELLRQQPDRIPDFADYRASDLDPELRVAEDLPEDPDLW
jgi:hypothetical protein